MSAVGWHEVIHLARLGVLVALAAGPSVALAEVMDKEPSLLDLWAVAFASAIVAAIGFRKSLWFGFLSVPLPLLFGYVVFTEITDPIVGPMILDEAGEGYIHGSIGAALLVVIGHVIGLSLWWRHRPTQRSSGRTSSGAPLR